MSMRLDGVDVLKRVLANPEIFPLSNDIDVIARKLVIARLKDKGLTLADLKTVCAMLGDENFKGVTDGISDAEAKSLVTKVDKDNKEAKIAGGAAQRVLLVELATGKLEPKAKLIKALAPKEGSKTSSGAGKGIRASSAGAKRRPKGG